MRGKFFVFEGIDGSGTSTQIEILAQKLRAEGVSVHTTREPSDGEIGKWIRQLIAGSRENPIHPSALALLFAADRVDHIHGEVREALDRGDIVLCDRYLWSSYTYQSLHCDRGWVGEINREGQIKPDMIFYFKLPAEVAFERVLKRGGTQDQFERLDLQRSLAQSYELLYLHLKALQMGDNILPVDASSSVEKVTEFLWRWFSGNVNGRNCEQDAQGEHLQIHG